MLCADRLAAINAAFPTINKTTYSIATFYRFFIVHVLPPNIEKIIYLDSDILVNLDIKELWRIELNNTPLSVVPEVANGKNKSQMTYNLCRRHLVSHEDYFNAGVLLMNLKAFSKAEDILMDGIKFISADPQNKFLDQDVLNYCFSKQSLQLPVKFNRMVKWCRRQNETRIGKKIYHYIRNSSVESFGLDMRDTFNRLWMKYFMRTPFFDVDTIGRLYAGVQQMHIGLKQSMISISALMSGKTRAFFTAPQGVDALKKIFSVRADEEIILAEDQTSLQKLLAAMNASRGKKVFFIVLPKFPFDMLKKFGFIQGRDFVKGMDFLSEAQGVSFNSHPLIQAM